ncbi:condensation domain-containing protein, partial [Paenibacillus glucanolyticus]|uniref:condensation domain-containing protein n=1 Tax=Paenibacillus glucanolyticus TaxID=59843 RepID=UPI0036CCB0C4
YQEYPFEELVQRLNPRRDTGRNVIFDTMFLMQKDNWNSNGTKINMESFEYFGNQAKADLTLKVGEAPTNVNVSFEYRVDLFESESIWEMGKHFMLVLSSIVGYVKEPISFHTSQVSRNVKQVQKFDSNTESSSSEDAFYPIVYENLCMIWKKHFEREDVQEDLNFFELGGHSFIAVQMEIELELALQEAGLMFQNSTLINAFIEHQTLAGLSRYISSRVSAMVTQ